MQKKLKNHRLFTNPWVWYPLRDSFRKFYRQFAHGFVFVFLFSCSFVKRLMLFQALWFYRFDSLKFGHHSGSMYSVWMRFMCVECVFMCIGRLSDVAVDNNLLQRFVSHWMWLCGSLYLSAAFSSLILPVYLLFALQHQENEAAAAKGKQLMCWLRLKLCSDQQHLMPLHFHDIKICNRSAGI